MATKAQLQEQARSDLALWRALTSSGDDASQPHTIDHYFVAKQEQPLRELANLMKVLILSPGPINRISLEQGAEKFSITVESQVSMLQLHSIVRESILMYALAEAHGVEYTGWETAVVRSPVNGA